MYREKAFDRQPSGMLPVAKELGDPSLVFLVHPGFEAETVVELLDVIEARE